MNKTLYYAAFLCGLLVLGWMAASYGPASPLALALLAAIACFYLLGAAELLRYRQASAGLLRQLQQPPADPAALEPWLAPLPAALQSAVRLRLLGQRVALPGPLLAPYIAGLLVLLGMLGTFLGLVLTLRGTGIALEQAGDVEAIRASLAAPVRGLGLAFGTSVAGVGASAALGLMTVLARGERQACASLLDKLQAGALRLVQPAAQALQAQRLHEEQVLQQMQLQTQHLAQLAEIGRFGAQLPALVAQLQQLGERSARQTETLHQELRSSQAQALQAVQTQLREELGQLAQRVGGALEHGLAEGARLAGATLEPAVRATLEGLAHEHRGLQATLAEEHHGLQAALAQEHRSLHAALAQEQRSLHATLVQEHRSLQQEVQAQWQLASRELQAQSAQALEQQIEATGQALQQQAASLVQQLGQAQAEQARQAAEHARAQLQGLQASLAQAMASQSEGLLAEVRRLVQTAADAPRAAAVVIGELRSALSDSLVRDNAALAEREQLLGTLAELLQALRTAGGEQRAAVDALVQAAARAIDQASQRLQHSAQASLQAQQQALAQAGDAAAGLAGMAEGFAAGVQAFASASGESSAQLARIEAALAHTLARSDEQLAYYVAQAREIVDLTLGTQRQVVEELQQIVPAVRATQARAAADAEASLP